MKQLLISVDYFSLSLHIAAHTFLFQSSHAARNYVTATEFITTCGDTDLPVRDSGRSRNGSPCMLHERGEIAVPRALVASPHVLPIAASDNYSRRPPAAPQCKRMRGGAAQLLRWPPTRVALVWLHLNQRPAARAIDSAVIVAVVVTAAAVALVRRQPQLESPAIEAALGSPLDSATKTGGCERVLQLL